MDIMFEIFLPLGLNMDNTFGFTLKSTWLSGFADCPFGVMKSPPSRVLCPWVGAPGHTFVGTTYYVT